mmetsp:Transcript_69223/g.158919  ORF Transcript_69223/g.158919 Transcript_69223/m.158919 type:complete len:240 (+) Transcript_69223:54-773(+)
MTAFVYKNTFLEFVLEEPQGVAPPRRASSAEPPSRRAVSHVLEPLQGLKPAAAGQGKDGAPKALIGAGAAAAVPGDASGGTVEAPVPEGPITTLMLRHLPSRIRCDTLQLELEKMGFGKAYNFVYVPLDKHSRRRSAKGYAFVNFVHPEAATRFAEKFKDYRFPDTTSEKLGQTSPAHLQGFAANMTYYRKYTRGGEAVGLCVAGNEAAWVTQDEALHMVERTVSSCTPLQRALEVPQQ